MMKMLSSHKLLFAMAFVWPSLFSCTVPTPDNGVPGHPDPFLKPQLAFAIDGVLCSGVCVAQRRSLAKITFQPPAKTILILVNTCARQNEYWISDDRKPFIYSYIYAMDAESRGSCPMLLTVVTSTGEYHRGIIDWSNINTDPATVEVECNGEWYTRVGYDICSVAAGLPVLVRSKAPAIIARDPESNCPDPKTEIDHFAIETRKPSADRSSLCVYVLITKDKKEFRLTTQAYSSILRVFPPERR